MLNITIGEVNDETSLTHYCSVTDNYTQFWCRSYISEDSAIEDGMHSALLYEAIGCIFD